MSERPDVLFLVHRIPYPPNRGDRIRYFHILKYLSKRANVYLATLADEAVEPEAGERADDGGEDPRHDRAAIPGRGQVAMRRDRDRPTSCADPVPSAATLGSTLHVLYDHERAARACARRAQLLRSDAGPDRSEQR